MSALRLKCCGIAKSLLCVGIVAISLVALLPVTALAQTVSFDPATSFNTQSDVNASSNPLSVAIGDFNGDGKPDLAVANANSNNVSVLLGTGTGAFGTAMPFAVGVHPYYVAIGDLNGDGKPDLAVANAQSDSVSILLGDGTGAFGVAAEFAVGVSPSFPNSVTIGDLNGDGHPDLAVTNGNNPGLVSVLLGTGAGTFGAATNVVVATVGVDLAVYPTSVAIGDFNGDGHPDLAVAMGTFALSNYGTVSISLGTGTGTFGTATPFAVGVRPVSVAIGDFNGDGHPDLAVVNHFSGAFLAGNYPAPTVSILLGTGAGTLAAAADFAVGSFASSVAIGDLNGDGHPDLAVANYGSSNAASVSVLLGTGTGAFADATDFAVNGSLASVAIGDLNGDGKPDLAVANEGASAVSIFLNTTVFPQPPVGTLTSIAVTPADPTINVGQTQQFTATGTFSEGSSRVLTSTSGDGTWATKAPMPTPVTGMVAGAIGGKLYVVGGSFGVCPSSAALQVYDPATDTWTSMAPLPEPRHAAAAGVIDGKLYVTGGSSNGCVDPGHPTVYMYDPATDMWTPKANMLRTRVGHAVAVIDDKLYALGGGAGDGSSFEMYDPVTDAWTLKASFPTSINNPAVGVVNGKLYAAGGLQFCCASLATLREYDPATNAWTSKASLPLGRNQAAGAVINGVFYVAAGINATGTDATNTLFAYDPATDLWTEKAPMSVPRATHPAATINGQLYVVGGGSSTGLVSSLEVYTPGEVAWSSSNAGVAAIDASGLSTGANPGTTTITATAGSISDSTTLTVVNPNQPPVANAGPDQTVIVGEVVTLDGSGSSDPDGIIASYGWNFADTTTSSGAITTHPYSTAGVYSVVLTVTDNSNASSTDTATVTVLTAGQAIQSLASIVQSFNLQQGITNSLDAKIQNALDAMTAANAGDRSDAANKLMAFINSVEAQRGKQLTDTQVDTLEALARRILAVI